MVVKYVHGVTEVSLLVVNAIVSTDMPFSEYLGSECCVYHSKFFL